MRKTILAAIAAVLMTAAPGCASTSERASVHAEAWSGGSSFSVSYFYDDLAPYGAWVDYPHYGWCWVPYDVSPGWRPYFDGTWIYTEFGWTWVSNEPWGWATYHYGRWVFDPYQGWIWVPGTVWGPAWVAWRAGDDWVGWAPLPPTATWSASVGLQFGDVDRIAPSQWCFVENRYLVGTNVRSKVVNVARNVSIVDRTRDVTRVGVRDGRPMNQAIDVDTIQRTTGRPVKRVQVVDVGAGERRHGDRVRHGRVEFYRPAIRESDLRAQPPAELRAREANATPDALRKQREKDRRRLEQALAKERKQLEREHDRERVVVSPKGSVEEVRRRHADERLAFERHAAEQRQVVEERYQKRIAKAGRGERPENPQQKAKGKQKAKGRE
jgi:hypothetical protein